MYKDSYLERVGEASEIPVRARAGRSVRSKLTAQVKGKGVGGHSQTLGRLRSSGGDRIQDRRVSTRCAVAMAEGRGVAWSG
jgi:hypothetical protein